MSIAQLPRLPDQTDETFRFWADKLANQLEAIFNAPQLNGFVATAQLVGTAAATGALTIPSTQNPILFKWASGTVTAPATTQAVTFASAFPHACWIVLISGTSNALVLWSATITASGFTATASANTGTTFNWLAIGN